MKVPPCEVPPPYGQVGTHPMLAPRPYSPSWPLFYAYKYVFGSWPPLAVPVKLPPPLKLAPGPVLVKLVGANFTGGVMMHGEHEYLLEIIKCALYILHLCAPFCCCMMLQFFYLTNIFCVQQKIFIVLCLFLV